MTEQDEIASLRAQLAEREAELQALHSFPDSPCGHSSMWAYTEDGGKRIECLLCIRTSRAQLEQVVRELVEAGSDLLDELKQAAGITSIQYLTIAHQSRFAVLAWLSKARAALAALRETPHD